MFRVGVHIPAELWRVTLNEDTEFHLYSPSDIRWNLVAA
jgi:hypothetical protein